MNCETLKPLVSEYIDGRLSPARSRQVRTHLDGCPECARLAQELQTLGGLLRSLPAAQTSADFDAGLARRIARTRRPSPAQVWLQRIGNALCPSPTLLRPALALGSAAAAAAVAVGVVYFERPITPPPVPLVSTSIDRPLVSQCVEQHRSYVAAQPLSDIAAQNLASQVDGTDTLASDTSMPDEDSL